MDRCWEHLRAAGAQLSRLTGDTACSLAGMRDEVEEAARGFELPQTAEAEAVHVFLDGLIEALSDSAIDQAPMVAEAAE